MAHPPEKRFYLASQSPRRRELLKQIGVSYDVLALRSTPGRTDVVEVANDHESASAFAQRMAEEKARSGWRAVEGRRLLRQPVMGADTVVECDGRILGKPADRAEAQAMLESLSGKTHQVHTALALLFEDRLECCLSTSTVRFASLDHPTLVRYLDSGEFSGKAGAYAIQGRAAAFVSHLDGSYSGVMGLPLYETVTLLRIFNLHP